MGEHARKPLAQGALHEDTINDIVHIGMARDEAMARANAAAAALHVAREALEGLLAAYSEPDRQICCSGRECGCHGKSVRDEAEHWAKAALVTIDILTKDIAHG